MVESIFLQRESIQKMLILPGDIGDFERMSWLF